LLYVNIQNLENKVNRRVATITQSQARGGSGLDTKISLGFATCKPGEGSSTDPGEVIFNAGLYLIRNQAGQYLSVPIYSITDSVYWVTPEKYEDPTKMPSYQWVLEPLAGTKFTLTNREFEKVRFTYVYVTKMNEKTGIGENLVIGDHYANAKFAKEPQAKIGSAIVDPTKALGLGEFARAKEFNYTYSFLPLAADVKSDQLLGYTYIDKDSTIVDVYALKYYHFLATGDDARYLGWNGYDNPKVDSALYANFKDFHNKLYFALEEMPGGMLATDELEVKEAKGDYKSIYEKYGSSGKTITLEKFGYFNKTLGILPLARQAYRLLLKDPLKFYPTIKGDYVTVGQQDRYILADKVNAEKPYVRESGRTEGLFGVPYFYFRDTYFDVTDNNPEGEDYFALVQRLDTTLYKEYPSIIYNHDPHYGAVWQYINLVWGDKAADRVTEQIKRSRELGAFIATVGDYGNGLSGLKIAVRGESVVAPSTFTLERDADPIYRRFHWNDYLERTNSDVPLVLEFHRLNNDAVKLFENSGADGRSGGGREYNLGKDGKLKVDSLGHEISFLGIKNVYTFPSVEPTDGDLRGNTNYSIYVDTAFINRGTGWIKPQYMLAVDVHKEPYKPAGTAGPCGGVATREYASYVLARYLFNSAMYAKKIATGVTLDYDSTQRIDETVYHEAINGVDGTAYTPLYSGNTKWERLAFTWAIHRGDTLYVLKGVPTVDSRGERYSVETLRKKLIDEYGDGTENCDDIEFSQLRAVHKLSMDGLKAKGKTIGLHAMIYLGDNYHKDWVFSFRFVERRADDFVIESETEVRGGGPIIRPGRGGWVVADNNVPVISRMDTKELMGEAGGFILNVKEADIPPVSNDQVGTSSAVTVVGEAGAITVLNAAGKRVIVTNALGQTVANEVVTSDNASISVPSAGVVFVSVDKGAALKAIVK
jgi:hypothetical protein